MARYKGPETEQLRDRWMRQGRGRGFGQDYKPWLRVGDFPNKGGSYRVASPLTQRTHHYFSALEYRHHLVAEYLQVTDIRENYPLHPISETLAFAYECGIPHPSFAGCVCSITTDSLLTVDTGTKRFLIARSLKYSRDLKDPRVLEKLELERRIWERRGSKLEVLTEIELPEVLEKNLRWLKGWQMTGRTAPSEVLIDEFTASLRKQDLQLPLGAIIDRAAQELCIARSLATFLFRYMAWHRYFDVDLYTPLHLTKPHFALRTALSRGKNA